MGRVPPAAGKPQNSLHLSSSEKGPRWNSTHRSAPGQRPADILSSGLPAENIRLHPASMIFSPRRGRRKDVQADGAISRGPPAISSFFQRAFFSNSSPVKEFPVYPPFPLEGQDRNVFLSGSPQKGAARPSRLHPSRFSDARRGASDEKCLL